MLRAYDNVNKQPHLFGSIKYESLNLNFFKFVSWKLFVINYFNYYLCIN